MNDVLNPNLMKPTSPSAQFDICYNINSLEKGITMMSPINKLSLILLVCAALLSSVEAFTSSPAPKASSALEAGRRAFLDAAMSASAGLVIASIPSMALAEEEKISDDLAMPSEEEQRKADVSRWPPRRSSFLAHASLLFRREYLRWATIVCCPC